MFLLFQNTPSTRHLFARYPSFGKAIIETANGTLKELQAELELKKSVNECTSDMAAKTVEAENIARGDPLLDALKEHCPDVLQSFKKAGLKCLKDRSISCIDLFLSMVADAITAEKGTLMTVTFNDSEEGGPWRNAEASLLALSASAFWLHGSGESETAECKEAVNCAVSCMALLKDYLSCSSSR